MEFKKILLYGVIGEGDLTAKSFLKEFQSLEEKQQAIAVHINSPGGSVWDGLAIFNAIKAAKIPVHTHVDGIAFSMAAMIALAGHQVQMAQGSILMLHNVSTSEFGHADKLRQTAAEVDKYDGILCDLISAKSRQSVDFVRENWLNFQDHYFSPSEALSAGLIDQITTSQAANIPQNARQLTYSQLVESYQANTQPQSQDMNRLKQMLSAHSRANSSPQPVKNEETTEEILQESNSDEVISNLLTRLENSVLSFEGILKQFESILKEEVSESEDLPAQVAALRRRMDAMSSRPVQAYSASDASYESKPSFETSYDRAIRKAFKK